MREKLTRFVLLAAVGVFAFTMVGLAQQRRPFAGVAQRAVGDNSLGNDSISTGLGAGSELPTAANSSVPPRDAEIYLTLTTDGSAEPSLKFYADSSAQWMSFVVAQLANNVADAANSVYLGATDATKIVAEGSTADAYESTVTMPDPGVDITYRIGAGGGSTANTFGHILDTGADPAVTVEVMDREFAPNVSTIPRNKVWFRAAPTFATGAPTVGIISACSTTGNPNWLYGPAITGYGFELDMKGTVTQCGPTWAVGDGMGLHADAGDNEGAELTQGIVDGSPGAFTIGTSPAFFLSVRFAIGDISSGDMIGPGFRIAAGYNDTDFENYTDFYMINVDNGDFYKETSLNTTTDVDQDLAETDWTDNQVHTIEIRVSAAGVVTTYIEGTLESEAVAFTFDDGDVVIPFFWLLSDTATDPDIDMVFWETGIQ